MREFWLENEIGEVYSFNDSNKCIAVNPSNFGIQNNLTYFEYTNSFVTATTSMPMMKPTLELIFFNGYQDYQDFLDYISNSKELKLYYNSFDIKYCLVDIYQITKTELSSVKSLKSQIVFNQKTMWMKEFKVSITTETNGSFKKYDYNYNYKYIDVVNNTIVVVNKGTVKAPLNYMITGNLINPEVVVEQNGVVVSKSKINVTYENAILEVVSEEGKELMQVTTSTGEVINVYQQQDFTTNGFIYLPKGKSIIKIVPGGTGEFIYNVTYHEMYQGN